VRQPLLQDSFTDPFSAGHDDARWRLRSVGSFPAGDGVVSTGPDGLVVVPTATDPETGLPAFAPEPEPLGDADHLRWAAMANHTASTGVAGFDAHRANGDGPLTITAELAVQGYGLDRHPYDDLDDPGRDLRVGAGVLITIDMESGLVLDFIVTDRCVFAVYERLGFPGTGHAAFSYAVPVADRDPDEHHRLAISYDAASGTARWHLGDDEVLSVDQLGRRVLDERHLKRDNGKPEAPAAPRQLTCGVGLFTDQVWGQGFRLAVRSIEVR
jgi:hypothetical protein